MSVTRVYHRDGTLPSDESAIFVFGSNRSGRHGKGAALVARNGFGAVHGVGRGPTGRSYAIPTKGFRLEPLSLAEIRREVEAFLLYAQSKPAQTHFITRIGCGLAGNKDADVAPMFAGAPLNCDFPIDWRRFLEPA